MKRPPGRARGEEFKANGKLARAKQISKREYKN